MALGAFNDNFMRQAIISMLAFGSLNLTAAQRSIWGSLATALMVLPFFLFSSLAGQLSDRHHKSTVVKGTKLFELAIMCLAGALFIFGQLDGLFFVLFLMGAQSAFFGPVKYGLLPEVLEERDLIAGNGLFSGATFLAIVLGTMFGSYLVTTSVGPRILMPIGLVSVALLGYILAWLQPRSRQADPGVRVDPLLWRSTYAILKSVKDQRGIWLAILSISWFWAMGSILLTQMPVLAATVMGAKPVVNTVLVTLFALGVAAGSLLVNRLTRGNVTAALVPGSAALLTVLMLALGHAVKTLPPAGGLSLGLREFAASPHHLLVGLLCLAVSMVGGVFVVPLNAFLQHQAEAGQRARVIAANNIMNSLFMVAGSLAVMLLVKLGLSIAHVFLLVGLSAMVVTVLTIYFLPETALRQIVRIVLSIVYRPRVRGLENLEPFMKGSALIIPNHLSFADVALLVAYIPRSLTFAIDSFRAQSWWIKLFMNVYKAIPINPSQPMAARDLIAALDRGDMLVIFPEGRLNQTGSIMKIYDGAGLVAAHCGCPVIPVILEDLEYTRFGRLRALRLNRPRRLRIRMTVLPQASLGEPIGASESRRDYRRRVTANIYSIMVESTYRCRDVRVNVYRALEAAARRFGHGRTIIEDDSRKSMTYGGLLRASRVLGRYLADLPGLGQNVGLLLPNANPLAVLLFGLWAGGRVPVMLNYSQGPRNIRLAVETANVSTVITSRRFVEAGKLDALLDDLPAAVLFLEDLRLSFLDKLRGLLWRPRPGRPDDPAVILFTSGSEGVPKGVALSHANMVSDTWQARTIVEIHEDDVFFNPMPSFHAFGLNVGLVLPLILGLRLYLHPSPLQLKVIPERIYDTKSTVIITSDSFAQAWGEAAHQYDFHRVRLILVGAEKLKEKTFDLYFRKLGVRLFEGYGVTEASPIVAVNTHMWNRFGSVGHIIPGQEWRLEPIEGLAEGGRLLIRGPNIMLGYLSKDRPGQVEPLVDGWYDTGDIAQVDRDGFLWIKGRYKRFAKISGEMVSLSAIEDVARTVWPELPLAILAMPDQHKGERLVLVHQGPGGIDLAPLRQAIIKAGFTELSYPRLSLAVPDIPLTPLGKANIPALAEEAARLLEAGEGRARSVPLMPATDASGPEEPVPGGPGASRPVGLSGLGLPHGAPLAKIDDQPVAEEGAGLREAAGPQDRPEAPGPKGPGVEDPLADWASRPGEDRD
jgi:acyl-[acyl-carrier-protein]-phospholipid O-acyltransferase/long-chain-fatty-acid--[acyl-carrier-protein] ligase